MRLAAGIGVPKGVIRRSPGPAGFTATKLITAAVAGPNGTLGQAPVPATKKFLVPPAGMGPVPPCDSRVSKRRQGVTGVYTRSAWLSPRLKGPRPLSSVRAESAASDREAEP